LDGSLRKPSSLFFQPLGLPHGFAALAFKVLVARRFRLIVDDFCRSLGVAEKPPFKCSSLSFFYSYSGRFRSLAVFYGWRRPCFIRLVQFPGFTGGLLFSFGVLWTWAFVGGSLRRIQNEFSNHRAETRFLSSMSPRLWKAVCWKSSSLSRFSCVLLCLFGEVGFPGSSGRRCAISRPS